MTLEIETKFYEEQDEENPGYSGSGEWHTLSKIVFTSPNLDSPNTAGTRSHILPGGGVNLGLWYEDVTYMYRMAECQQETWEQYTNCSGTLVSGTCVSGSGYSCFCQANSVNFEVTAGECYDCRLTAWDDATHSTTLNEIIAGDHCRVSAAVFYYTGSDFKNPDSVVQDSIHIAPVYNRILKGNTSYMGMDYYYGDFNMQYRYNVNEHGDFLIFKPMLYGLTSSISYGVHDFVIVLHYSYT
jgi:hypothetical protein